MAIEFRSSKMAIQSGQQARSGVPLVVLLSVVVVVLGLTMPRFIYVGDAVSIRMTTIRLLSAGEISVPAEVARAFGERGQYFFEHPRTRCWYSKYGVLNTFLFAPPLLVEQMCVGDLKYFADMTEEEQLFRCLLLNVWNIAVAIVFCTCLYRTARLFSARPNAAAQFVLLVMFGTFLWHYVRAQTVELFQITLFTAAFFHLLKAERCGFTDSGRRDSVAALLFVGLLALSKLIYAVTLPFFISSMIIGVLIRHGPATLADRAVVVYRELRIELGTALSCLGVLGFANWYRFGAPWVTGYQQFARESTLFTVGVEGFVGYLVDPQKSVFLYFPILLLAMSCIRRIRAEHRLSYGTAWACFIACYVVNASFVNWRGDWCYGPRYLIFALPVLSLPIALEVSDGIGKKRARTIGLAMLLVFSMATINNPFSIHGAGFFSAFRAEEAFTQLNDPEIADYFKQPHWVINRELRRYLMKNGSFKPRDLALSRQPEWDAPQLDRLLVSVPYGNFYWLYAVH
ncbi:MAG: hypothetical protein O3B13_08775 [Planctomycetota bacterium]|nr:hypothetical protein [Planctomycetota bacterium]